MKRALLHVGCGSDPLPDWLQTFSETRLDISPEVSPDIVASMLDMGDIGPYDAVLCQHALEHLFEHEVAQAVSEFRRVLKPGGHLIVIVPDLQDVQATEEVLLMSPAGPITGLDMIYGYRKAIPSNPHMQHKTGFMADTLRKVLTGFSKVSVERIGNYNLLGACVK
jgi:SAM-dependent methyltransferase